MKAKNISGQAPGGKRTLLADVLPLETPFLVQIFPIYACNFKCSYCIFSVKKSERYFISDKVAMPLSLLKKCVDEMTIFPKKIKVLRFVGIGEPLLHKNLGEMIEYSVRKKIADKVELLTNASLLTREKADELLRAGLDRLVVSVQGTTREKYKEICGTDIDFEAFLANLKYFYENRKKTEVYIKVVDTALDNQKDQERFFEFFGNYCDTIAVEYTVPIHKGIDYQNVIDHESRKTQFGLPVKDVKICPQPFFTMQINPDGKIVPCYSFEYPEFMGDCNTESVTDIWKGETFRKFRRRMLDGVENASAICKNCSITKYRQFPEDDLSKDAERLKKYYE